MPFPKNCPHQCPLVRTPLEKFPSQIDPAHVDCLLTFAASIGDITRLYIALNNFPAAESIFFACSAAGMNNHQMCVFKMLGHVTEHVKDAKLVYHESLTISGQAACVQNRVEYFPFFCRLVADLAPVYVCTTLATVVESAIEKCPGEWKLRVDLLLKECRVHFSPELYTETIRSLFAQNAMGGVCENFSRELAEFLLTKGTFDMDYMLSVACSLKRSGVYPFLREKGAKICPLCNMKADEHF